MYLVHSRPRHRSRRRAAHRSVVAALLGILALLGALAVMSAAALYAEAEPASQRADQAPTATLARDPSRMAPGDRLFLRKAAQAVRFDIALGQLAAERSADPDLRGHGRTLALEQGKTLVELGRLAEAWTIEHNEALDRGLRRELERLSRLPAPEFERNALALMLRSHREAIVDFETAARAGYDADLRDFAAHTLSSLQAQRLQAETLLGRLRNETDARAGSR